MLSWWGWTEMWSNGRHQSNLQWQSFKLIIHEDETTKLAEFCSSIVRTNHSIGALCQTGLYIAVATLIPLKVLLELTRAELTSSVRYLQSRGTQPPSHAASSSLQIQRSSHALLLPRSIEAIGMSAPANATGSPAVSSVSCSHKDGGAACWRCASIWNICSADCACSCAMVIVLFSLLLEYFEYCALLAAGSRKCLPMNIEMCHVCYLPHCL
ncbi:uncharacterized protein LOC105915023 isoform X2 [Setaria italica]|uniref:uncharacterized protein LOC105915023 isoform X2 n=1 Tax=Setaria italica TaxID=4555 RepID=UPI000BE4FF71|nr:uncharacterized protein LOC105915023 isoform X2 [Setaria italica]